MVKNRILLLEDDINLSETIAEYLEEFGFEVIPIYDGDEAFEIIYEQSFDLFLLDVNVSSKNGFEVLKLSRESGDLTPAIFITSLNSIDDLELGYESGCDDYIRKPFVLKELKFRIDTLIKRNFAHLNSQKIEIDKNIFFDLEANELINSNRRVSLQTRELKLLKLFLQNRNRAISHEEIYNTLWSYDENYSESSLRTYIKNLRKIIGKEKIISIKKVGYKFA